MTDQSKPSQELVENMGIFFEKSGISPVSGRVFAFLLLSEPPYQDFYSIQDFVKASKSSISNALNYLIGQGNVDYITFAGDRKRYFRVNSESWLNKFKSTFSDQLAPFGILLERILEQRKDPEYAEFNDGLREILSLLNFIVAEFPMLVKKWEDSRVDSENVRS